MLELASGPPGRAWADQATPGRRKRLDNYQNLQPKNLTGRFHGWKPEVGFFQGFQKVA
jgi:hypothetical protein